MKKYLSLFLIALCGLGGVRAQSSGDHCVAFKVALPTDSGLTEQQERTLALKCTQIVNRNKAARTAFFSAFAVVPYLDIADMRTIGAGTADITVVEGELTLVAMNVYDKSQYGTVTVRLEGSGNTEARAYSSLLQQIRPDSPVFARFVKQATEQIIDYYDKNMSRILALAQNLVTGEQYEDALTVLTTIPFCVPAYMQSSAAIDDLLTMIRQKNCTSVLAMANRLVEAREFETARKLLLSADTATPCDPEIQQLLQTIREQEPEQETHGQTKP